MHLLIKVTVYSFFLTFLSFIGNEKLRLSSVTALEAIVVEDLEVSEDIMVEDSAEDSEEDLEVTEDTEKGQLMPNLNLADMEVTEVVSEDSAVEVLDTEDLEVGLVEDLEVMEGTMASDQLPPAAPLSALVQSLHQANKDVNTLTQLFQIN